ncbi:hypothetical protein BGW41_004336 [Actinomortierella wolfii]|nr:hypothetical protein BGW41_004336 [Actinomortierella wolfii]
MNKSINTSERQRHRVREAEGENDHGLCEGEIGFGAPTCATELQDSRCRGSHGHGPILTTGPNMNMTINKPFNDCNACYMANSSLQRATESFAQCAQMLATQLVLTQRALNANFTALQSTIENANSTVFLCQSTLQALKAQVSTLERTQKFTNQLVNHRPSLSAISPPEDHGSSELATWPESASSPLISNAKDYWEATHLSHSGAPSPIDVVPSTITSENPSSNTEIEQQNHLKFGTAPSSTSNKRKRQHRRMSNFGLDPSTSPPITSPHSKMPLSDLTESSRNISSRGTGGLRHMSAL